MRRGGKINEEDRFCVDFDGKIITETSSERYAAKPVPKKA